MTVSGPGSGVLAGGHRKGFVFSLIAISFLLLLVLLAATMSSEFWENERVSAAPVPNSFAAASVDRMGAATADLLLPVSSVTNGADGASFYVSDNLPRQADPSQLQTLKEYAENEYAAALHASISVNTTKVANNSLEARVLDNYVFQSTLNNSREMAFRSAENATSTGATQYAVGLYVNDYREYVDEFDYSGSGINVTVRYSDRNGTEETTGFLDPDSGNTMTIHYTSGSAEISIGSMEQGGLLYYGALAIALDNEKASYSFTAQLPEQPPGAGSVVEFPVRIEYVQDGVRKTANATR